jgi:hypothetical protein
LSFVVLAGGVVMARRWHLALPMNDSRRLVLPLFMSLSFMALLWDSDVLFFYTIKEGFVPCAVVGLSSRRVRCLE